MALVFPQLVVLDSATLGKIALDYWSPKQDRRNKARQLIAWTKDNGIYVTFSFTHVIELLGHGDLSRVDDRMSFLRALPHVAWIRPFKESWFPGTFVDLMLRELRAVVQKGKRDWESIVADARENLFETGTGAEIFVQRDELWLPLRKAALRLQAKQQGVASVLRTDPGDINSLTIGEWKQFAKRDKSQYLHVLRQFAAIMTGQLKKYGDERVQDPRAVAVAFAKELQPDLGQIADLALPELLDYFGVPQDLVNDKTTIPEVGQIAAYAQQLNGLGERLCPPAKLTIQALPMNTLPSYELGNELEKMQRKADRVSGSDFGDSQIAPLIFYADAVEVDKRTRHNLAQVKKNCQALGERMQRFFQSADYADIPNHCNGL